MEGIFFFEVYGDWVGMVREGFFDAERGRGRCILSRNCPTSSMVINGDDASLASGKPPSHAQNTIEKT